MFMRYAVIDDPPSEVPEVQVNPRVEDVRSEVFSAKLIGASGLVMIKAPFPALDA